MEKMTVPICDFCGKPHFGRENVKDRCVCDTSGNYHMGEIDAEETLTPMTQTPQEERKEIRQEILDKDLLASKEI